MATKLGTCDRCNGAEAVIKAAAFCPDCDDWIGLCEECFAWHIKENIEELEYEREVRKVQNGN